MQQTETNLWQELNDAVAVPQIANLKRLCELLDWAIEQIPEDQQLGLAGRAIEQMVEIYALRFSWLMGSWGEADAVSNEALPVLNLGALEVWVRQSMSVDLDALIEQPRSSRNRGRQTLDATDSILGIVSPDAVLQMVEQIEEEQVHMIQQLAGEEDPGRWSAAIAQWLQNYAIEQPICLVDFYQELGMPLVEIWIGLLLGEFELEQHGQFYEVSGIWVCSS
ncbi:hypothetical protein H6F95_29060 [Cyanobacteria bacterium FACHB-471]|nr:hypothetical protein [Cyanobacteria bacterium FACHB-471]